MSFDLYFCSPKGERVDFDAVAGMVQGKEGLSFATLLNSGTATKILASISVWISSLMNRQRPRTRGFLRACLIPGLSFNLNFNRPSFFGFEAMPYVEELSKRFNLQVIDAQQWEEPVVATEAESKSLISSWLDHNRRGILALMEQDPSSANPLHMPLEHSLYLWRFRMAKKKLKLICGEELYVPHLTPVHQKDSKVVSRAFTCTQGVPTMVPESEWVFIVRGKKGFFQTQGKA